MADTDTEERKKITGFDPEFVDAIGEALDALPADADELTEGGLAEADMTLVGFGFQKGGEEKVDERTGKPFTTTDALVLHLRIDNAEDLGLDDDHTVQFIRLPKANKKGQRATPTRNSAYGAWLNAWEALGITAKAEMAHRFHLASGIRDLAGIKFHRTIVRYELDNGQSFAVPIPTDVFGFDNEIRTSEAFATNGVTMAPAELVALPE
ncbi:MAG: hypothetical protein M0Q49_08515 [Porticoccaceae bacterium]|nr:hypothetical protein [Porticoccaceae bacterium]